MGFFDFAKSAGGGSLIGSVLSGVGSYINGKRSQDTAREQMAMQREFAQNGIRWKVADAKAAGIHPLAALGAQTFSYNPVAVGDDGLGSALSQMGQGITRAVEAKQLQEEREAAQARQEMEDVFNAALRQKQLERLDLENDFMRTQIAGARQSLLSPSQLPPAMPKVNASDSTYSSDVSPLMSLSRHGTLFVEHLHPDIADAITEDMVKNLFVIISAEGQSGRAKSEAFKRLGAEEQLMVLRGDADLIRIPDVGWQFVLEPHMRPKYSDDGRSASGRLNLTRW